MNPGDDWHGRLESILQTLGCQTGTLHRTTASGDQLRLLAQIGVPDSLLDKISLIPFGKGIAGVAAQSGGPVELCNLQQDLGGVAREDARKTGVAGSIAVPIPSSAGGAPLGTLGVGKRVPHEFTAAEKERLEAFARDLAGDFAALPEADD